MKIGTKLKRGIEVGGYKVSDFYWNDGQTFLIICDLKTDKEGIDYQLEVEWWDDERPMHYTAVYAEECVAIDDNKLNEYLTDGERQEFKSIIEDVLAMQE